MDKFWENYIATRPTDSKGAFDAFKQMNKDPRPMTQGSRNMYQDGQLVTPSVDGSRPGYAGEVDRGFYQKLVNNYKQSVLKDFESGDMSKTSTYRDYINKKYKKNGNKLFNNSYRVLGTENIPTDLQWQKKNQLLKKLITDANNGEKYIQKKDIISKVHKTAGGFADLPWADMGDLKLHTSKDKVSKVLTNIIKNNEILQKQNPKFKLAGTTGLIREIIAERTGIKDVATISRGLEEAPQMKNKQFKSVYDYLTGYHARDFEGYNWKDAYEYAADRREGAVKFKNVDKLKMYRNPDTNTMSFILRHWDRNHFNGIDTLEKGNRVKFYWKNKFDTNGKPLEIKWKSGLRLNQADVSFTYDGKPMKWNLKTLKTHGKDSGLFDEVRNITNSYYKTYNTPVKGSTKSFGEMIGARNMSIGHNAPGGVKADPLKNFQIQSSRMNLALYNATKHIKNKDLQRNVIKNIYGSLWNKRGDVYINEFIKNFPTTGYKEAGQKVIGQLGPGFLEKSEKFKTEALKVAGIDWKKPEGRLALKTLTTAQTLNKFLLSKGHKICRGQLVKAAGGGRIGFKGMCGAEFAKNFPEEFISRIGNYPNAAKAVNSASKGAMNKFLNAVAKDVAHPFGWIGGDLVFSTMFSGAAEAEGKTPLEALDEGLLWFLPKGVIDAKKKALFGYEGTPSGAFKMEGHAGMYDKDQIADMSAYLDIEKADRKWNENMQELAALNTKINTNPELFGQVTSQQIENSRNRLQSNMDEASIAGDTLIKDIYTRNTGLRFEDGKPFKKELSEEEFGNLYGQIGENLWDVQKRYAMEQINRGKQADLNTLYANRKGTIPGVADIFAKGTHALGWTKEGQLPLGMGERGTISTAITDPWDRYRASSPMKAGERLPAGIKQGYQKILDLWNMGLVSQEEKEKYAKEMGREDLLHKEHAHPLYGPALSYQQYQRVFPEYFGLASGGRAGYMGGGIAAIRKPHAIPPERQGLRSIMINGKKS